MSDSRPQGHYLLAYGPEGVYIRVVGLASMNNCTLLGEVLSGLRAEGFQRLMFDLAACSGFDSTFMGLLLGLTRPEDGADEGPGAAVVLVNASPEHRRLLAEVGVDRLVRLLAEPLEFPQTELRRLEEQPVAPQRRIRSIFSAHENLVRLGGANVEKFGSILESLRRELGDQGGAAL
jgi:hypothetical protein